MERAFSRVEELVVNMKDYIRSKIEGAKITAAEKTSGVMSIIIAGMIVAGLLLLFVFFAGIALAIGIGAWIGNTWAGFLLVAVLYLLIALIVWKGRNKLIRLPIMNALIRQLMKNNEEDQ